MSTENLVVTRLPYETALPMGMRVVDATCVVVSLSTGGQSEGRVGVGWRVLAVGAHSVSTRKSLLEAFAEAKLCGERVPVTFVSAHERPTEETPRFDVNVHEITLDPQLALGMTLTTETCEVTRVKSGGQAETLGIAARWRLISASRSAVRSLAHLKTLLKLKVGTAESIVLVFVALPDEQHQHVEVCFAGDEGVGKGADLDPLEPALEPFAGSRDSGHSAVDEGFSWWMPLCGLPEICGLDEASVCGEYVNRPDCPGSPATHTRAMRTWTPPRSQPEADPSVNLNRD